ncbi:MAG: diacylglycerol kinase family protein [Patescibacteria group bacterium]|nr:diacylglycerol kinase family protein [Patescibacteria group bacterium]
MKSFGYATRGLIYALEREQNFRLHMVATLLVIVLMIFFGVTLMEAVILTIVIMLVLVLELVNIIFERLTDIVQPRIHHYAKVIKDLMATAVLVASLGALVVGILIFFPYLF